MLRNEKSYLRINDIEQILKFPDQLSRAVLPVLDVWWESKVSILR